MTVPTVATYSAAAKVAAQTSFLGLLDAGTGPGYLALRSAADVLLAQVALDDPAGTVNGTTGQLTLDFPATTTGITGGDVAYGEFCDSDDTVHLALPAVAGEVAVSGKVVLNTLTVLPGAVVAVISATVG